MFDKLDDLLIRFEEIMGELQEPDVVNDQTRFRSLMKEQNDLAPIVEAYKEYKKCNETIEDSLAMLEEESDEEMRELLKEELADARKRVEELEHELKILLLPKDPMTRTLSLRSVPVPAETRLRCSRQRSTGCIFTMQNGEDGNVR